MIRKIIARSYLFFLRKQEKKLGYTVNFEKISNKYIQSTMISDMTAIWKKFGLNAGGINYFTFGKIENDLSTRFDLDSMQFQSWIGCYLVKDKNKQSRLNDIYNLANADQCFWLQMYGDPNPFCDLNENNMSFIEDIEISGFKGRLYEGGGVSHCDNGKARRTIRFRFLMWVLALIMSQRGSKQNIYLYNCNPKLNSKFDEIYLKGYFVILNLEDGLKLVLYGNGTEKTWPIIKSDVMETFKAMEIIKI